MTMGSGERSYKKIRLMAQAPTSPLLAGKKILLAVEGKLLREVLVTVLQQNGASRFLFGTGVEMLRQIRDFAPDLVYCEYQMSMVSGVDFIHQIRNNWAMKTPALLLVPRTDGEAVGLATKAGASATVGVPFSANELVEATRKLLNGNGGAKPGKINWDRYS